MCNVDKDAGWQIFTNTDWFRQNNRLKQVYPLCTSSPSTPLSIIFGEGAPSAADPKECLILRNIYTEVLSCAKYEGFLPDQNNLLKRF